MLKWLLDNTPDRGILHGTNQMVSSPKRDRVKISIRSFTKKHSPGPSTEGAGSSAHIGSGVLRSSWSLKHQPLVYRAQGQDLLDLVLDLNEAAAYGSPMLRLLDNALETEPPKRPESHADSAGMPSEVPGMLRSDNFLHRFAPFPVSEPNPIISPSKCRGGTLNEASSSNTHPSGLSRELATVANAV